MNRWAGKRIGPFKLKSLRGEGASSVVYEASFEDKTNPRYGETVALKIMRTQGRVDEYRRWLETEIKTLKKVRHPGIVRLVPIAEMNPNQYVGRETVEDGNPFYFAMKLLSRDSLREVIGKRYSLEWRLELFYQIMVIVDYLHYGQLAHRDLKPENIGFNIEPDGKKTVQPVLMDFGLAGAQEDQAASPQYASPERLDDLELRIKIKRPTGVRILWGAYDIYAMGLIAYELFNGRYPYQEIKPTSNFTEVIDVVRKKTIQPMNDDIRKFQPLHDLILLMLQKDPQRRPNSQEILDLLDTRVGGFKR
jgi:serine/threonine protein kinase